MNVKGSVYLIDQVAWGHHQVRTEIRQVLCNFDLAIESGSRQAQFSQILIQDAAKTAATCFRELHVVDLRASTKEDRETTHQGPVSQH